MTDNVIVDLATEKRIAAATATSDAAEWTPRDVLVQVLRDIDAGVYRPTALVVGWIDVKDDKTVAGGYTISSHSVMESVFMAEKLKQDLWNDGIA